jgi:RNA polymerase sigma factor (sigma-70 family)
MTNYSDVELLKMLKEDSTQQIAFRILVQQYQEKIYHSVRRMVIIHEDADDIVQNVFIKVWKNLHQFREDSKLFTWIYRIALNETISFLNQQKLRSLLVLKHHEVKMLNSIADDHYFEGDEIQRKLQEAIIRLPSRQRMVFNMRYYDEISYEEMSSMLGTSEGALKASYHIASKKIAEYVTMD